MFWFLITKSRFIWPKLEKFFWIIKDCRFLANLFWQEGDTDSGPFRIQKMNEKYSKNK